MRYIPSMISLKEAQKYGMKRGWTIDYNDNDKAKTYKIWAYKIGTEYVEAINKEKDVAIQAVFNAILVFEANK